MKFGDKAYDRLKYVALIVLPAASIFYLGLSQLWGFPEPEKVGATLGLLTALLGSLLQISSSKFKKNSTAGYISAPDPDDPDAVGLPPMQTIIRKLPEEMKDGDVFRVQKKPFDNKPPPIEEH